MSQDFNLFHTANALLTERGQAVVSSAYVMHIEPCPEIESDGPIQLDGYFTVDQLRAIADATEKQQAIISQANRLARLERAYAAGTPEQKAELVKTLSRPVPLHNPRTLGECDGYLHLEPVPYLADEKQHRIEALLGEIEAAQ